MGGCRIKAPVDSRHSYSTYLFKQQSVGEGVDGGAWVSSECGADKMGGAWVPNKCGAGKMVISVRGRYTPQDWSALLYSQPANILILDY